MCVCVQGGLVPNKDVQVFVGNNLPRDRKEQERGREIKKGGTILAPL